MKNTGDKYGVANYGKLCYRSKYPWEATPKKAIPKEEDVSSHEKQIKLPMESMQYVLYDEAGKYDSIANVTYWVGEKEGVLYRRQFFDYRISKETHWMQAANLADITVPYGILRADRLRLYRCPVTYTLGAYGFPDNGTVIIKKSADYMIRGNKTTETAHAVILKGFDSQGSKKQLAMTIYDGWERLSTVNSQRTNPDSYNSIILFAEGRRKRQYGGFEQKVIISQVITRESHEDFSDEDLFPIEEICYEDEYKTGAYGEITLCFKTGETRRINFEGIEAAF